MILQLDALLEQNDENFFIIALYIVFAIIFLNLLLFFFITFRIQKSRKKTSTILTYFIKIFSIYALLLNKILAIPFFNILLGTLICFEDDKLHGNLSCYSGIYFLHFVIALLGLIIQLFFSIFFHLLFIDLNPCSNLQFAAPQSRLNLIRLMIKLALPLYIIIDYKVIINFFD